jgi:hypothetical protein
MPAAATRQVASAVEMMMLARVMQNQGLTQTTPPSALGTLPTGHG